MAEEFKAGDIVVCVENGPMEGGKIQTGAEWLVIGNLYLVKGTETARYGQMLIIEHLGGKTPYAKRFRLATREDMPPDYYEEALEAQDIYQKLNGG